MGCTADQCSTVQCISVQCKAGVRYDKTVDFISDGTPHKYRTIWHSNAPHTLLTAPHTLLTAPHTLLTAPKADSFSLGLGDEICAIICVSIPYLSYDTHK